MLNDEQLEEVRAFFTSPTASLVFQQIESGLTADWITANDLADRERCWQQVQSLWQLYATLRDVTAMKQLTRRNQERRGYTT